MALGFTYIISITLKFGMDHQDFLYCGIIKKVTEHKPRAWLNKDDVPKTVDLDKTEDDFLSIPLEEVTVVVVGCGLVDPVTLPVLFAGSSGEVLEDVSIEETTDREDAAGAGDWDV